MIVTWMLFAVMIGALLLLAAHAAESVFVQRAWPRRLPWIIAMVLMCAIPFVAQSWPELPTPAPATATANATGTSVPLTSAPSNTPVIPQVTMLSEVAARVTDVAAMQFSFAPRSTVSRLDRVAIAVWATLSASLLLLVGFAVRRLRQARATWTPASAELHAAVRETARVKTAVWISQNTGPAAFGLRRAEVVLPEWALELPESERTLLVTHEAEHVRASDPQLLSLAVMLLLLCPWHAPLLYAYRRLCRAVEQDCDARVLAQYRDARTYGRLLVRTAEWLLLQRTSWRATLASRLLLAPVPAFAAPASQLESRLRALAPRRSGWRSSVRVTAATCVSGFALLAISCMPAPKQRAAAAADTETTASPVDSLMRLENAMHTVTRMFPVGERLTDSIAVAAARRTYPEAFSASAPASELIWLLLDSSYTVVQTAKASQSAQPRFNEIYGRESMRPGTIEDPPERLDVGHESFVRAFPKAKESDLMGMRGSVDVKTETGTVTIWWMRYDRMPDSQTAPRRGQRTGATSLTEKYPPCDMTHSMLPPRKGRRDLRDCVIDAIQIDADRLNIPLSQYVPPVWLVLDSIGQTLGFAASRAGTISIADYDKLSGAKAKLNTAAGSFAVAEDSLRAKFPTLATRIRGMGVTSVNIGPRVVNVIYSIVQ